MINKEVDELDKEREPMSASFDITHIRNKGKYTTIPDTKYSVRELFGLDTDWEIPGFRDDNANVPEIDKAYHFDPDTTMAILAGFAFNRRVIIQGYHGTGKSTNIEQVAARLNWPCVRINLDSHVSRMDLVGKDMIVLKEGKQITEFREGLLPWSIQNPVALVFDEYDAGRPDVMFVIQRVLESEGRLTLLDQNTIIRPHRLSGCLPQPILLASATRPVFTTARSRSIRRSWTAGISWRRSITCLMRMKPRSCCARSRASTTRKARKR
jgi:hypothetical protein